MVITRTGMKDADYKFSLFENHEEIAHFDDFTTAALVCRFIKGGRLEKAEYDLAVQEMKQFDEKGKAE